MTTITMEPSGAVLRVPFDPAHAWGVAPTPIPSKVQGKGAIGHPVRVTLNGHRFDGWVRRHGGRSFLLVDPRVRRAASVVPGEAVEVAIGPRAARRPRKAARKH